MDFNLKHIQPPHGGQPVFLAGAPLEKANGAVILLHGRGASAYDILGLSLELENTVQGVAYLAPQASGYSWYPYSFLASIESNEPGLSSGLAVVDSLFKQLLDSKIPAESIFLAGFSQGACLALEYIARYPLKIGGVAGLSGGLIGPPGIPRHYTGSLDGISIFLGCSDVDAHIPAWRVEETSQVLTGLGAEVDMRFYPGMGHMVNADEIAAIAALLNRRPA